VFADLQVSTLICYAYYCAYVLNTDWLSLSVEWGDEKVIDGQVSAEIFLAVFSYVPDSQVKLEFTVCFFLTDAYFTRNKA
jgi:hypothetical protein